MKRSCLFAFGLLFATPSFAQNTDWMTSPRASILAVGGSMMNGNHFADATLEVMREHYAGTKTVALVLHPSHVVDRDKMERRLKEAFMHLGGQDAFSLHRFDTAEANRRLAEADAIFVGGGDTFMLLREFYETGQLGIIRQRVLEGVPLAGSSAGANICGPVIGTTNDFPVTDVPTRRSLAIIPVVINPHHPRADQQPEHDSRAWKIRNYLRWNPTERVMALGDRAMIRLHEGELTIALGPAWEYRSGKTTPLKTGDKVELE
ncbi:MAG: type 1 glutamine amidotransferase-like domain-containing protein [Opitutaceae bacterium]|nr:type 1 glutamine amidotransferase-like domain-containing protein [Opitutaceae bacterium]